MLYAITQRYAYARQQGQFVKRCLVLTEKEAAAHTQAATWHSTHGPTPERVGKLVN